MYNYFLISIVSLFFFRAFGAELSCSQNGTDFYYINGVNVKYDEGLRDLNLINSEFVQKNKDKLDYQKKVKSSFIYNSTRGLFNDVKEIYNQSTRNLTGDQREYFYRKKMEKLIEDRFKNKESELTEAQKIKLEELSREAFSLIMKTEQNETADATDALSDLDMIKIISKIDYEVAELLRTAEADTEVIISIKKKIKESFELRKKMIMIAHSQGNEALRSAVYELRSEMSGAISLNQLYEFDRIFGIVHVASPSPTLAITTGKARLIKLDRDLVIKPAGIILPQNPIGANYIYKNSNLSGIGDWPIIGDIAELFQTVFGGNLYHGMSYIYLSDKVNAASSLNPEEVDTMSGIFSKNLREVAQSLDDNCSLPIIKIVSTTAEEKESGVISVKDYAGVGKKVRLEISDVAGNSSGSGINDNGYDLAKTTFQYTLITKYPNGASGALATVEDEAFLLEGKYYIDIQIPYRDYQYSFTITARNELSKEVQKSYKISFEKNKPLIVDIHNLRCNYDSDGYNTKGTMFYDIKVSDDEYTYDNKLWTSSMDDRSVIAEFRDSGNIVNKEIINSCEIKKPIYRYEIWKGCQWGPSRACWVGDCSDVYLVNTGLEYTDILIYNDHGKHVKSYSGFEGSYGYNVVGGFPDPNDETQIIHFDTAAVCEPFIRAAEPQYFRYQ